MEKKKAGKEDEIKAVRESFVGKRRAHPLAERGIRKHVRGSGETKKTILIRTAHVAGVLQRVALSIQHERTMPAGARVGKGA